MTHATQRPSFATHANELDTQRQGSEALTPVPVFRLTYLIASNTILPSIWLRREEARFETFEDRCLPIPAGTAACLA